jgi:UDP-2,3-diacylglucosamine pyrophosphatase LpxH
MPILGVTLPAPALGSVPGWALAGLGGLLLAWLLDAGLLRWRRGLPMYRRHLAVFAVGVAAAGLAAWCCPTQRSPVLVAGVLGAALGLALGVLPFLRGRRLRAFSWACGAGVRPEPSRDLILVADPHWRGELVGLAAATASHPDADWLFLGDVFDVWVGLPSMATAPQRAFLDWVRGRRAAGRWVGLWLGNREYFLDGFRADFDLLGEGTGGGLPAEGLAFEHGDWINHADWKYRLWNVVSRSGPMWLLFRLLPGFLARPIAAGLEARLRTTNRAYKLAFPQEAFAAAAEAAPGKAFLTGHFHTLERAGKGLALPWAFEGRFWVWRNGAAEPLDSTSDADPAP